MTKRDKEIFFHFIVRTGMYISTVDDQNIVSFVHGYECGSRSKVRFTSQIENHFSNRLHVAYGSTGWPGQITAYAKKKNKDWVTIFKEEALDMLFNTWPDDLIVLYRSRFFFMLKGFDDKTLLTRKYWIKDWNLLCSLRKPWFRSMWSDKELKAIRAISKELNYLLDNKPSQLVSAKLVGRINDFSKFDTLQRYRL
ncbi:MAG: hypothetical protein JSS76_01195 [Bacteroidetes bacterium]|nr:hypothetical protein [Bacteroidota bacterium]